MSATYSRAWARNIFNSFHNSCTRARIIDSLLLDMAPSAIRRYLTTAQLHSLLIDFLSDSSKQRGWNLYKRACRKKISPSKDIIALLKILENQAIEVDVEQKQRQLQYD